jgi:glutaredoxin 3
VHFVEDASLVPPEYRGAARRQALPSLTVYHGEFTRVGHLTRGVTPAKSLPRVPPAAGGVPLQALVYSAPWCTACHAAKDFLKSLGVQVVERDIEADKTALQELTRLAGENAAIPVIVVGNAVIPGFDRDELKAAVDRARR